MIINYIKGYRITYLDVIDILQNDIQLLIKGSLSEEDIRKQYNFTINTITHLYKIKPKSITLRNGKKIAYDPNKHFR